MYNPENQYRCSIIRGKSQTEMEDLLPLYANIVHKYCPCSEDAFRESACSDLAQAIFHTRDFNALSDNNKKTIRNHFTEIQGVLLNLYYPAVDKQTGTVYIYESESCKFLNEQSDFPTFFKNLCLNYQFPNGEKKATSIKEEVELGLHIKPFCFVIKLLYIAQSNKLVLSKQEIGYYALNNLDVLSGKATAQEVYDRIVEDRKNKIRREKLSGSREWQHIKEQFNLLELANLINHDAEYIWLNKDETNAIVLFLRHLTEPFFDVESFNLDTIDGRREMLMGWKKYNASFNQELLTKPTEQIHINAREDQKVQRSAMKSTTDLGDEGEYFVFKLEQERVRTFKERLVNKVLLLGKTKGLGYDISSIEAAENPNNPEFARYIEVKATKRITRPSFNATWLDTLNITRKEWIAAEQFGKAYNIYRVYFTKDETIVVRINNPFALAQDGKIDVIPTIYQMDFSSNVIEMRYPL